MTDKKWLAHSDYPEAEKTDSYCWAELRCTGEGNQHRTYVTMCFWWEGVLYDADDGCNVDFADRISESRIIGVMEIDKPEPAYVHKSNVPGYLVIEGGRHDVQIRNLSK